MNFSRHSLVYFKMDHIIQPGGYVDHFKFLPRPYSSIALSLKGGWDFREYRHGEPDSTGHADVSDILYVPMGSTYDGTWRCDGRVHIISLHFELDEIGVFGSRRSGVQAIRGGDFRAAANDPAFDHIKEFERIAAICDENKSGQPGGREQFELVWRFLRLLEVTIPCLDRRDDSERDPAIDPALSYLRRNFASPCQVSDLAKLCNLSDSHFYVRFKRATGVTPIEYKNRLMISNAERLLLDEPDLPIEEVAGRMGFSSSTYFRRIFKQMSSYSPRDFRKNGHESL